MQNYSPARKLVIWLITSLFFSYQFLIRVFPHVVNPELMERFSTSAAGIAQFLGVYYIGYTAAHIPVGALLDRVGPKFVIPSCVLLVCLGMLPLSYSNSLFYATLGRILIGIGSSAGVLGVFKVLRMFYPANKVPFLFGISITIGLLGAACGGKPFYYVINELGWEYTLNILNLIGLALAIAIFILVPKESGKEQRTRSFLSDLKILSIHPKWLLLSILGGLMVGPVEGFTDGWAMAFLASYYPTWGMEILSFLPSLILIGMGLGGPLVGYIAEKTKAYYTVIVASGLIMAVTFIMLLKFTLNLSVVICLFIIIGLASAYQTVVLYYASILVPEKVSGLTIACSNMIIMCFGYIFHTLLGILMDYNSVEGNIYYSPEVFAHSLTLLPIALLIASVGFTIMGIQHARKVKEVTR